LLFFQGFGKSGAFTQANYLEQVLTPHIQDFIDNFATITYTLSPVAKPLFMEDRNSAHGHKSTRNYYTKWRTAYKIVFMPHPSTSPNINPIEKYWR
jgi:hypothetical protein